MKVGEIINNLGLDKFKDDCMSLNINLNDKQIDDFLTYYNLLIEWNSFMNLTAITDFEDVLKKHFIDSMSLINAYDLNKSCSLIDVGTGAGFPGLALKIAFPEIEITLLDSLNKRVNFLNTVIDRLNLKGIKAFHGRAEEFAKLKDYRESFDLCVSRAVANLSTLSEYCLPFVKVDGYFISYKSEKIEEEAALAKNAFKLLGGEYFNEVSFYLPNSNIYRNLYMVKKVKSTPGKYPRKAGLPSKEPL